MKPSLSNYTHPRPVWLQVLGDTLLYAGNFSGFASLIGDSKTGAYIGFGVGVLAYFFSKLYKAIEGELVRQETTTTTIEQTTTIKEVPPTEDNSVINNK
jgi:hypothetical protein